ncbi:DUF4158 domain-containing protein [Nonomuraea sp. NPDC050783]|uniref:DUF4158 domain-containing protein n=1 Tax=Nonomuraea sp. NPDC050783 TaxID=3154634 RepID=UPI0034672CAD
MFSAEQVRRYGAFVADPTPEELERFFFLDAAALDTTRQKRRRHNWLGWAVQWGTVRMLGMFLEDPVGVPRVVVEYPADPGDRPRAPRRQVRPCRGRRHDRESPRSAIGGCSRSARRQPGAQLWHE